MKSFRDGKTNNSAEHESITHSVIPVSGMACANCALAIEKKLQGTPGVFSASVNFANEMVTVGYDPQIIELSGIFNHIRDAGYIPLQSKDEKIDDNGAINQRNWVVFSAILSLPVMPLMYLPMTRPLMYA